MATTIKLKNGSGAPLAGDLVQGEPALDLTNKRLYTEDSGGTVIEIGTSPSTIDINAGTIDGTVIGGASAAAGTFTTFTSTGIDDNATSTAITIDSSQNVGIGTTNTNTRKVSVTGTGDLMELRSTNAGAGGAQLDLIHNSASPADGDSVGLINFSNASAQLASVVGKSSSVSSNYGELHFGTRNGGTYNGSAMVLDRSGNVGIGTTSPSSDSIVKFLHINDATSSGLVLQGAKKFSVYSSSSSSLIFRDETAGTNRITLDSSGNVGIGTTSPSATLHSLVGSAGAGTLAQAMFGYAGGSTHYLDANTIIFRNGSATETMRIDSSGRVGIGITPSYTLDIQAIASSFNPVRFSGHGSSIDAFLYTDTAYWSIGDTAAYGGNLWGGNKTSNFVHAYTNGSERMRIDSSGTAIFKGGATNNAIQIWESGSEKARIGASSGTLNFLVGSTTDSRMAITSSGNVGIGTTSPARELEIRLADDTTTTLGQKGGISLYAPSNTGGNGGEITWASAANGEVWAAISGHITSNGSGVASGHLVFGTADNSALPTERMRIDSSGNVLIGRTSTPSGIQAGSLCINFDIHHKDAAGNDRLLYDRSANLLGNTGTNGAFYAIGVGTTSPNYALDVVGAIRATNSGGSTIIANRTSNSGSVELQYNGTQTAQFSALSGGGVATYVGSTPSEAMRIDSSGNLLIGVTTSVGGGSEGIELRGDAGYYKTARYTAGSAGHWLLYNSNGNVGSVTTYSNSTQFNTSSDQRLKENIVDAPAGNIDAIRVRSFDWKTDGSHQKYGMVAQELVDVAPEAVTQGETDDDMWQVDYSKLVPMMIKEIQDLKAEVAALKGA